MAEQTLEDKYKGLTMGQQDRLYKHKWIITDDQRARADATAANIKENEERFKTAVKNANKTANERLEDRKKREAALANQQREPEPALANQQREAALVNQQREAAAAAAGPLSVGAQIKYRSGTSFWEGGKRTQRRRKQQRKSKHKRHSSRYKKKSKSRRNK